MEHVVQVSVVVVAFGSEDVIEAAISGFERVEVVLVEQSASGESARIGMAAGHNVRVVLAGANRGFGAGCNLGAAEATGDVLVFLNPDARMSEEDVLALADRALAPGIGMIGPRIRDDEGGEATRARRWSHPVRDGLDLLVPRAINPQRWHRELPDIAAEVVSGGPVPLVQGSCFAVQRRRFFDAGGFDERLFLYGEEEVLASRLAACGLRSYVARDLWVEHVGGTSTDKVSRFATRQMFRSWALVYEMRFGRARGAIATFALGTCVLALLLSRPVRVLVGFRPLCDARWCFDALRGLVSGLVRVAVTPPPQRAESGRHWTRWSAE